MRKSSIKWQSWLWASSILLVVFLCLLLFLKNYFVIQNTTIFGLMIFPYLITIQGKQQYSYRYLPWAFVFILFGLLLPVKSIFFFTAIICALTLIEMWIGKTNHLPLFLLFLVSPMLIYFRSILGISVRFYLSEFAATILSFTGLPIQVFGNTIQYNQETFSIDPACMGLSMLTHSFLLGLFIMAYFQKSTKKILPFYQNILLLLSLFILNIISNLIRIVCLILFKVYPELIAHDIFGIICLILYVLVPFYFLCKWIYNQHESKNIISSSSTSQHSILKKGLSILLCIGFIAQGSNTKQHFSTFKVLPKYCNINNCEKEQATKDVLKFTKENVLIYVKPIPHFYSAEHSPLICWSGSGYHFNKIEKQMIGNIEIFIGILQKDKEPPFYSCWWFDNGKHKTSDQWDWRTNAIKTNTQYSLINVNAPSYEIVKAESLKLLNQNIFNAQPQN